jgi:guanylate kinase
VTKIKNNYTHFMIDYIIHIDGRGGSGKSTIVNALNEKFWLEKTQNFTTRKPRFAWESGYYFVSQDEFLERFRNNEILECYFRKSNQSYYGLPAPTRNGIVQCEVMGKVALKKWCFQNHVKFLSIYIDIAENTLLQRLSDRGDTNEKPEERLVEDEYYEIFKNWSDIVYDYNGKTIEEGVTDIMNLIKLAGIIA